MLWLLFFIVCIVILYHTKNIIIFLIVLSALIYFIRTCYIKNTPPYITIEDYIYILYAKFDNKILDLSENNKLEIPIQKDNKILIASFDNRPDLEFVKLHNKNLENYTKKHGYDYIFTTKCLNDVYWCKVYLMYKYILSNKYDYVMILDSDTIIVNDNIKLNDIINSYSSDIFMSDDNEQKTVNAGIFMIKNSDIGRNFLKECLESLDIECLRDDKKLNGAWSASCYEQGQMNIKIREKYYKYTTLLNKYLFRNQKKCDKDAFIIHYYGMPNDERAKCFSKFV